MNECKTRGSGTVTFFSVRFVKDSSSSTMHDACVGLLASFVQIGSIMGVLRKKARLWWYITYISTAHGCLVLVLVVIKIHRSHACSHKAGDWWGTAKSLLLLYTVGHDKRDKQSIIQLLIATENQMVQATRVWLLLLLLLLSSAGS